MRYRKKAMIVAPQPEAAEVGADILRAGGNAVDIRRLQIRAAVTSDVGVPQVVGHDIDDVRAVGAGG